MTPTNRQRLLDAYAAYNRERYPSVPERARFAITYKDNSANALTKCIVDYIRFTGGFAERVNRMGFQTKTKAGRTIWVSGGGTNGTADISAVLPGGKSARIEVKFGRDTIKPDQIRYAEKVQRAGALYFIARTFDGFMEWYDLKTN